MTPTAVRQLQALLNNTLRPPPGLRVDGVFGLRTRAALHDLQRARHSTGAGAAARLNIAQSTAVPGPSATDASTAPWMHIAEGELGQSEVAGPGANPRIIAYHSTTGLAAQSDEVAWCSSFVNWVMLQAGYAGTKSAAARSWTGWGQQSEPRYGAIMVIRHNDAGNDQATGSTSGFHVAFWVGADEHHISLLGGNQHDMVKVSRFPLARYSIQAARWPA